MSKLPAVMRSFVPTTTIEELAKSPLLDELDLIPLAVYVRIVAASKIQGKRVQMTNSMMLGARPVRGIGKALEILEQTGLVKVKYIPNPNAGRTDRIIELVA